MTDDRDDAGSPAPEDAAPTNQSVTSQLLTDKDQAGLDALRELINEGGWRRLPAPPGLLVVIHVHPDGSVDTLKVGAHGDSEALMERTNAHGHPVKRETGDLLDIVELVRTLPPPGHPGPPTDVIKPPPLDMDALFRALDDPDRF